MLNVEPFWQFVDRANPLLDFLVLSEAFWPNVDGKYFDPIILQHELRGIRNLQAAWIFKVAADYVFGSISPPLKIRVARK